MIKPEIKLINIATHALYAQYDYKYSTKIVN